MRTLFALILAAGLAAPLAAEGTAHCCDFVTGGDWQVLACRQCIDSACQNDYENCLRYSFGSGGGCAEAKRDCTQWGYNNCDTGCDHGTPDYPWFTATPPASGATSAP